MSVLSPHKVALLQWTDPTLVKRAHALHVGNIPAAPSNLALFSMTSIQHPASLQDAIAWLKMLMMLG